MDSLQWMGHLQHRACMSQATLHFLLSLLTLAYMCSKGAKAGSEGLRLGKLSLELFSSQVTTFRVTGLFVLELN